MDQETPSFPLLRGRTGLFKGGQQSIQEDLIVRTWFFPLSRGTEGV